MMSYADNQCYKQSNNKLALVCFILQVRLCENLQKQQKETPSYFEETITTILVCRGFFCLVFFTVLVQVTTKPNFPLGH